MQFETRYDKRTDMGGIETVVETHEVSEDEIAELLDMALAGSLDGVSAETIQTEIERRSE